MAIIKHTTEQRGQQHFSFDKARANVQPKEKINLLFLKKQVIKYLNEHDGVAPRKENEILEAIKIDREGGAIYFSYAKEARLKGRINEDRLKDIEDKLKNRQKELHKELKIKRIIDTINKEEKKEISQREKQELQSCENDFGVNLVLNTKRIIKLSKPTTQEGQKTSQGGNRREQEEIKRNIDPKLYSYLSFIKDVFNVDTSKLSVFSQNLGLKKITYYSFSYEIDKSKINEGLLSKREKRILSKLGKKTKVTVFISDNYANATFTLINQDEILSGVTKNELREGGAGKNNTAKQETGDCVMIKERREVLKKDFRRKTFNILKSYSEKQ